MRDAAFRPFPLPRFSRRVAWGAAAVVLSLLFASPKDAPMAERPIVKAPTSKAPAAKAPAAKTPAHKVTAVADTGGASCITKRTLMTLRGEIVDYYCYIEKGGRGPEHRECAVRCVSGDICMGILTTDGQLFMISRNHLRAMSPVEFRGIPDPFNACVGLIAETVDITGYAMERKGQKILEIMGVKKTVPGTPIPKPRQG